MIDDILKSLEPSKGHSWKLALALLFLVVSLSILLFLIMGLSQKDEASQLVSTTTSFTNEQRISVLERPSGVPLKNPSMTDAERIKIMNQPRETILKK